jgi:acyl CoA:acetate/3-ketoacid CoA transferase
LKTVRDPYSGDEYIVVPPIIPDVAVIHATKGDRYGGVTTLSIRNDRLLAMAARVTIAVVEDLREPDEVLPGPHEVYVSGIHVDHVVVARRGAHPTECPGHYEIDTGHLGIYMNAARDEKAFHEYLDTYILGPEDHDRYLSLVDTN